MMETQNSLLLKEQLKHYRENRGYSQQTVADYLQISRTAYVNYERGLRLPDIYTLDKLARLYSISIEKFLYPKTIYNTYKPLIVSQYEENKEPDVCLSADELELLYFYRQLNDRDREEIKHLANYKMTH